MKTTRELINESLKATKITREIMNNNQRAVNNISCEFVYKCLPDISYSNSHDKVVKKKGVVAYLFPMSKSRQVCNQTSQKQHSQGEKERDIKTSEKQ